MEQYKEEFIHFMVEADVLKFGEFTLKSGRKKPASNCCGTRATCSPTPVSRQGQPLRPSPTSTLTPVGS